LKPLCMAFCLPLRLDLDSWISEDAIAKILLDQGPGEEATFAFNLSSGVTGEEITPSFSWSGDWTFVPSDEKGLADPQIEEVDGEPTALGKLLEHKSLST
jgi:hypothetical protein